MSNLITNRRQERDSATTLERLQNCLNAEFVADASIPDGTVLNGGEKVRDIRQASLVLKQNLRLGRECPIRELSI